MISLVLILFLFLLDQFAKQKIEDSPAARLPKPILNGTVVLRKSHNKGMFLNLLDRNPTLCILLSALAFVVLCIFFLPLLFYKSHPILKSGICLAIAGSASNVWDHIRRGYVVDYFSLNWKRLKNIVFNLGDFFIFIGFLIILLKKR